MILHMSRGFVLGVLATCFVAGGAAGYLVRGSGASAPAADAPALARGSESLPGPAVLPAPKPASRTTASLKSAPTPGSFYRLAGKETLSDVAKRAYGSTKRLPDLLAVNASLDPKHLAPGTLVYVPLGIEPIPMLAAETSRPEPSKTDTPKAAPPPPGKSAPSRASAEPAPLFAKPK